MGLICLFALELFAAMIMADEPTFIVVLEHVLPKLSFLAEVDGFDANIKLILCYNTLIKIILMFHQAFFALYHFFVLSFDMFSELVPVRTSHQTRLIS